MALFAMVILVILGLVIMGTTTYRRTVEANNDANATRAALSYVATTAKSLDSADCCRVEQGAEGDVLVLTEDAEGVTYETRLYLHDGYLVEEYAEADSPLSPDDATRIARTDELDFKLGDGGLLTVTTSWGTEHVALRSMRAGDLDG